MTFSLDLIHLILGAELSFVRLGLVLLQRGYQYHRIIEHGIYHDCRPS